MSALPGVWAVKMSTPIGSISADMTFAANAGLDLSGVATSKGETVELRDLRTDPTEDGEHVTWSQSITKPIRLNLDFDVIVQGDTMRGHSRAGRLPRSVVTGHRRPA